MKKIKTRESQGCTTAGMIYTAEKYVLVSLACTWCMCCKSSVFPSSPAGSINTSILGVEMRAARESSELSLSAVVLGAEKFPTVCKTRSLGSCKMWITTLFNVTVNRKWFLLSCLGFVLGFFVCFLFFGSGGSGGLTTVPSEPQKQQNLTSHRLCTGVLTG